MAPLDTEVASEPHRPVTLNVLRYGEFNDPMMGHRMAYSAEGQINRRDFGLTLNMMLDGKMVVGLDVKLMIELELVEQKEEQLAGAGATGDA